MFKKWALGLFVCVALNAPAWAQVQSQILEVNVQLSSQQITPVQVRGFVKNHHELTIRDVRVSVSLMTPDNQVVRRFYLPTYEHIKPGVTHEFNASQILNDYPQAYVKAQTHVDYKSITYLQVADWIVAQNWHELALWNIPVTDDLKMSETERVNQALDYLTRISADNRLYAEARRKWNILQFNDAKRLFEKGENHEAMLRLANVEPHSQYYAQAQAMIDAQRIPTIYKRAMKKAEEGNLRGAYRQILYIPGESKWATQAQNHQEEWLEELKKNKVWLGALNPPAHLSPDQKKVWLRRSHGPEGYTTSTQKDGQTLTTWWYLDYSHYTFNQKGQLVSSKVY